MKAAPKHSVLVHVPALPGQDRVWRRKTVLVTKREFDQIRKWKNKGYQSKSAMVLDQFSHRVYHVSTQPSIYL